MYDVECPYCGAEIEINHDDGYGYEEDETIATGAAAALAGGMDAEKINVRAVCLIKSITSLAFNKLLGSSMILLSGVLILVENEFIEIAKFLSYNIYRFAIIICC